MASLFFFEIYLISNFQNKILEKKIKDFEKNTNKKYNFKSKIETYKNFQSSNKKIVVSVPPSHYLSSNLDIQPLSGISNATTIHCKQKIDGNFLIYKSDRYGFNNPDSEWNKNIIDFLLVGDSFTHGSCVPAPNDIASNLRHLSKKNVLSLGYEGNGPLIEYAVLREHLVKKMKKIIWIYYEGNDIKNFYKEMENSILMKYLENLKFSQNIKSKQNQIDQIAKNKIREELNKKQDISIDEDMLKKIKNFIKLKNTRNLFLNTNNNLKIPIELKNVFNNAKKLADLNKSKIYFVYLPEYKRYTSNYNNTNYLEIKKILTDLEIKFIDIHDEVFSQVENPLTFFPYELPGHYTIEGYKVVTEKIYEYIK
ncbi:hypothetical protein OAT05_00665 [Candidatus Pelagibacter sp.]|nr:hypothetical protein [Candidatus Pelagibacter sp.]